MTVTLTEKVRFYESIFGSGRMARNCKNFDVRCPICDPKDVSKKKLAIHVDDDKVHCWVCGFKAYTLAPLVRKFGTRDQLIEYRERFMPDDAARNQYWSIDEMIPEKLKLPKDFRLLVTSSTRDGDASSIKKYLVSRGLTDDDLWYYKIGFSNQPKWIRRAIIPSFDKTGELNHYVGRTVDKFKKPKYETPEGERKLVIFNEINVDWKRLLVVCEGALDMVKCGDNVVPMLGSDLNEQSALFNAIVANETPIALALDADMRYTKMPRVAKKLAEYNIDVSIVHVTTDPGDMTKRDFREALKAATPFDWDRAFRDKLEIACRISL